jgi:hypothetical protein
MTIIQMASGHALPEAAVALLTPTYRLVRESSLGIFAGRAFDTELPVFNITTRIAVQTTWEMIPTTGEPIEVGEFLVPISSRPTSLVEHEIYTEKLSEAGKATLEGHIRRISYLHAELRKALKADNSMIPESTSPLSVEQPYTPEELEQRIISRSSKLRAMIEQTKVLDRAVTREGFSSIAALQDELRERGLPLLTDVQIQDVRALPIVGAFGMASDGRIILSHLDSEVSSNPEEIPNMQGYLEGTGYAESDEAGDTVEGPSEDEQD